jgi:hypothetical protein
MTRGHQRERRRRGFKGGKRKCKFSSILRASIDEKNHQPFMTTEKSRLLVSPSSLFI